MVTVTLFAPMFKDPQGVKDKELARFYRTLLRLNASTFTLSGTVNFGVMGAERGFIALIPVLIKEFGFLVG